jgi:hypothetical protein
MTNNQHRVIGSILGYPSCCVEEWVLGRNCAGIRRGSVFVRYRSKQEVKSLNRKISSFLGYPWSSGNNEMRYVPCSKCITERTRVSEHIELGSIDPYDGIHIHEGRKVKTFQIHHNGLCSYVMIYTFQAFVDEGPAVFEKYLQDSFNVSKDNPSFDDFKLT